MKPLSIVRSLVYSILILSLAVYLRSLESLPALSYGWMESFYRNHYWIYSVVSLAIVILGGIILTDIFLSGRICNKQRSFLPLLFYSSSISLAVGENFLYIASASFLMVFSLNVIIARSRDTQPLSDVIFKIVLVIFLKSLLHPAMIWMVLPLAIMIVYFKSSALRDLFLALVLFSAYYAWAIWFFEIDCKNLFDSMLPKVSFGLTAVTDFVAIYLAVMAIVSWNTFKGRMVSMNSMACKLEQFSLIGVLSMSPVLYLIEGSEWFLGFFAAPVAIILSIHLMSISSARTRLVMVLTFFAVVAVITFFLLKEQLYELLNEPLNSAFDYVKGLYGGFWNGD